MIWIDRIRPIGDGRTGSPCPAGRMTTRTGNVSGIGGRVLDKCVPAPHLPGPMRYAEFRPSEALAPLVRCFWTLGAEGTDSAGAPEPALPDGSTELIFNLADPFVDASEL